MRSFGIVASAVTLVFVLFFVYLFLRSLPDLARYRRLRKM